MNNTGKVGSSSVMSQLVWSFLEEGKCLGLSISAKGSFLALSFSSKIKILSFKKSFILLKTISISDDSSGKKSNSASLELPEKLLSVPICAFHPQENSDKILAVANDMQLVIFDVLDTRQRDVRQCQKEYTPITDICWSRTEGFVLSIGGGASILQWDAKEEGSPPKRKINISLPGVEKISICPRNDQCCIASSPTKLVALELPRSEKEECQIFEIPVKYIDENRGTAWTQVVWNGSPCLYPPCKKFVLIANRKLEFFVLGSDLCHSFSLSASEIQLYTVYAATFVPFVCSGAMDPNKDWPLLLCSGRRLGTESFSIELIRIFKEKPSVLHQWDLGPRFRPTMLAFRLWGCTEEATIFSYDKRKNCLVQVQTKEFYFESKEEGLSGNAYRFLSEREGKDKDSLRSLNPLSRRNSAASLLRNVLGQSSRNVGSFNPENLRKLVSRLNKEYMGAECSLRSPPFPSPDILGMMDVDLLDDSEVGILLHLEMVVFVKMSGTVSLRWNHRWPVEDFAPRISKSDEVVVQHVSRLTDFGILLSHEEEDRDAIPGSDIIARVFDALSQKLKSSRPHTILLRAPQSKIEGMVPNLSAPPSGPAESPNLSGDPDNRQCFPATCGICWSPHGGLFVFKSLLGLQPWEGRRKLNKKDWHTIRTQMQVLQKTSGELSSSERFKSAPNLKGFATSKDFNRTLRLWLDENAVIHEGSSEDSAKEAKDLKPKGWRRASTTSLSPQKTFSQRGRRGCIDLAISSQPVSFLPGNHLNEKLKLCSEDWFTESAKILGVCEGGSLVSACQSNKNLSLSLNQGAVADAWEIAKRLLEFQEGVEKVGVGLGVIGYAGKLLLYGIIQDLYTKQHTQAVAFLAMVMHMSSYSGISWRGWEAQIRRRSHHPLSFSLPDASALQVPSDSGSMSVFVGDGLSPDSLELLSSDGTTIDRNQALSTLLIERSGIHGEQLSPENLRKIYGHSMSDPNLLSLDRRRGGLKKPKEADASPCLNSNSMNSVRFAFECRIPVAQLPPTPEESEYGENSVTVAFERSAHQWLVTPTFYSRSCCDRDSTIASIIYCVHDQLDLCQRLGLFVKVRLFQKLLRIYVKQRDYFTAFNFIGDEFESKFLFTETSESSLHSYATSLSDSLVSDVESSRTSRETPQKGTFSVSGVKLVCCICGLRCHGLTIVCPLCGHGGHRDCFREWRRFNQSCPKGGCDCSLCCMASL